MEWESSVNTMGVHSWWHEIDGFTIPIEICPRGQKSCCPYGNSVMKFAPDCAYSNPEKAARKLIEIANSVEAIPGTAASISS